MISPCFVRYSIIPSANFALVFSASINKTIFLSCIFHPLFLYYSNIPFPHYFSFIAKRKKNKSKHLVATAFPMLY